MVGVEAGQNWRRKSDGKAPVNIGRIWISEYFCGGGTFVRCHPLHGGKHWCALIEDFLERYERIDRPSPPNLGS
jgi:hypothetical protein